MRKILLGTAFVCAAAAANAGGTAVEPIAPLTPMPTVQTFDWSGFYAGGNIGYADGTFEQSGDNGANQGPDVDVDGAIGALRLGYNLASGNLVYGADFSVGNGPDGITDQGTSGPFFSCVTGDCNADVDVLASLRGRLGYASGANLFYGAAGLAYIEGEGGIENSDQQGDFDETGYTVAVGFERLVSQSFSVYGEVAYYDFDDVEYGDDGAGNDYSGDADFTTISFGVNYQF